jgi:dTDP-glucose 4,6-dehydratase
MRILITGALGFVLSNYVNHILDLEMVDEVCIVDSYTYAGSVFNLDLKKNHHRISVFYEDVNSSKLEHIFDGWQPHTVIIGHAESHVDNSIQNSKPFWKSNVEGVASVLDQVKRYSKNMRVVHISTDEVLGSFSAPKMDGLTQFCSKGFNEDWPLDPSSPYSASKAAGELVVESYKKTHGLSNVAIVRPTNMYGPRQHPEKLLPKVIQKIKNDEEIPVYGKGDQIRDWLFVEDFCLALDKLVWDYTLKDTYHVSAMHSEPVTNLQVIEMLGKIMGKEPRIKFVTDRPAHDFEYRLDSSMFRDITGWKPQTSLEEGLRKAVEYYIG